MDARRFDDLTKAVAGSVSRREVLRKLGVGVAGAALAVLLPTRAPAEAKATKTIQCKIQDKDRLPTGEKSEVTCAVECEGDAGYCVTCGGDEEEGASCMAMCCSGPDCEPPPTKEEIKAKCQRGTVKVRAVK